MTTCRPTNLGRTIDLDALRARYRQERDKRLRTDGAYQYAEMKGELAEYRDVDPFTPVEERAATCGRTDVLVVGGGFAGLLAGANLWKAGVYDVTIVELGGDFGGTWYWNRYPGAQCDVEAYTYLPLLEDLQFIPQERYSYQPEIFRHCQNIGRHFGLYKRALFHTGIMGLVWKGDIARWEVTTDRGDRIHARFVILAPGPYGRPKLPGIPGVDQFKGHAFHTARWDYEYTGGDASGSLTKLRDKRVAIIGTGATAVQCVPFLAKDAQKLYVFQRTPSYVDIRGNRPTDPEWAKSLSPGWQAERQANYHAGVYGGLASAKSDLTCDGWTEISRNVAERLQKMDDPPTDPMALAAIWEEEDFKAMSRIRDRVDEIVSDPKTAEALKPWYRFMCKRPCFNDDYLPAFNQYNVTLVDVAAAKGVERITQDGVVANGVEYPMDCLIYASGFEITDNLQSRYGIPVIQGKDGISLYEHWREGYRTLHGLTTDGFPNLFFTGYTQTAVAAAINLMYDQQTAHIAYIISEIIGKPSAAAEPTTAAVDAWNAEIHATAIRRDEFYQDCTPGYYNKEGQTFKTSPVLGDPFGPGFDAFDELLRAWRSARRFEGLAVST